MRVACCFLVLMVVVSAQGVDFASVSREVVSEPVYGGGAPAYGLFVLGDSGQHRLWVVLDRSRKELALPDVAYVDLDLDGRIGEAGEKFLDLKRPGEDDPIFKIGGVREPGRKVAHGEFVLTVKADDGAIGFEMLWEGQCLLSGGSGRGPTSKLHFGKSRAEAPIMVLSPVPTKEFLPLVERPLRVGRPYYFGVRVGVPGSTKAAFTWIDPLAREEFKGLLGTLSFVTSEGKPAEVPVTFEGFNCTGYTTASLRLPKDAAPGPATLRVRSSGEKFAQQPLEHAMTIQ